MKPLRALLSAIAALFVADGVLSAVLLAIIGASAMLLRMTGWNLGAELLLAGGCATALGLSVVFSPP